jgi:hypothetical protein
MFGTLIDVDTDGNIFAHSKAISLLPNMFSVYKDKYLGSKAVKWIVCMYDYKSPYRSLPMEQRKQIVNNMILEKEKCSFINKPKIVEAIKEYKKIIYDADIEEYRAMVNKSAEAVKIFQEMKVTKENLSEINTIQQDMGKAAKSRRDIRNAILTDIESGNKMSGMDGDDDLSMFEQEEKFKA